MAGNGAGGGEATRPMVPLRPKLSLPRFPNISCLPVCLFVEGPRLFAFQEIHELADSRFFRLACRRASRQHMREL